MSIQNVTSGCCIIYKTTNIFNGMIYPGFHKTSADGYLGSGLKLGSAIKKYGQENFVRETLEFLYNPTRAEWGKRETYWITILSACDPKIGYNLASGGQGGNWGNVVNKKISRALKNRPKSDEHKRK